MRIVGIRAVFQYRVVGVAVGFLCGRVIPQAQNPQLLAQSHIFQSDLFVAAERQNNQPKSKQYCI